MPTSIRDRQSRWRSAALLCLVAAVGLSCGDDGFTTAGPDAGGVVSVRITEQDVTMVMGDTLVMSAVGFDKMLSAVDGKAPRWTSSQPAVASIDDRSVLRARTPGATMVIAEIDGKADTALVTVVQPPIARLDVAPRTATVILTQQRALVATAFSVRDSVLLGRPLAWSSDDETVATVNAGGIVATHALGTAVVTVESEGKTASATITVVPVPVRQLVVTPSPAQVALGATLALAAEPRDSIGGPLAGRAVTWTSSAPAVVGVSGTGLLTGLVLGTSTVTATSEGVSTSVAVTVAAPSIALATAAASFAARHGGVSPAPQTIAVTNGGAFTLEGLAVAVEYDAGQPTGWLGVALDRTTAPATLTLAATTPTLAPGTYGATVTLSSTSTGAAARTVRVTLVVAPFPIIGLGGTSVSFAAQAGAADPAAQTIAVVNDGSGALTGLSATVAYAAGQPTGWLTATLDAATAPATLSLGASANLAPGSYTATVTIASSVADVAPRTVNVTHAVSQPAVLAVSSASVPFAAQVGGASPAAQVLDVTNAGTGLLAGLSVAVAYDAGQPTGWLAATLAGTSAATTLTLAPTTTALGAGVYGATVTVSSTMPGVAPRTVAVTATVSQTAVLALSSGTLSFASPTGAAPGTAQTVNVTNAGTGVLAGLTASIAYAGGQPTGWLTASLDGTVAPAVLSARATVGALDVGTYHATITIASSSSGIDPRTIAVTFVVSQGASIGLSATDLNFTLQRTATSPATGTVEITNAGLGSLSGLSASATYASGQPTGWLALSLSATTAPATLTATATQGSLAVGIYTATVTVASSMPDVAPRTVLVTLSVADGAAINLSATSVSRTLQAGDPSPVPAPIGVTNGGVGTLSGLAAAVSYTSAHTGWLSASLGATSAPTDLTLTPAASLPIGTHTANVVVSSSLPNVASRTITVTFTVSQTASITLGATARSFTAQVQQASPAEQTVNVSNGGTGVLDGLGLSVSPAAPWLTATLDATTGPTTLRLKPATGSLAAGVYTTTVTVSSSRPGVASRTVDVTFTVSQTASITLGGGPTFSAQLGGSAPSNQTVSVSNGGTGVLDGLSVTGVTYDAASGATAWLTTATLSATTAPTTLNLGVTQGALALGTYAATVTVGSSRPGIAAKQVVVTLNVVQNAVLSLSPPTWTPTLQASAASPATQVVSVANSGSAGTIGGLSITSVQPAWLTVTSAIGATAPTSFTLSASAASLGAGTFTHTVVVHSTTPGVADRTVAVTLTVTAAPVISTGGVTSRSYTVTRGSNPSSQAVSITNTGGGTLNGLTATLISGGTGWLDGVGALSINNGGTAPATLTITPTTSGLTGSPTNAVVRIASSVPGTNVVDVTVSVTVEQPQIAINGSAANFTDALGNVTRGTGGGARSVSVTRSGAGTLGGLQVSESETWLTSVSISPTSITTGTATLSYTVATDLPAAFYSGVITISSSTPNSGVTNRTVTVTMTVQQPQIGLSASSFTETKRVGFDPTTRAVTVTNSGSGTLSGVTVEAITYSAGASGWIASPAAGAAVTVGGSLSINPNAISIYGSYTATLRLGSTVPGVSDVNITVTVNNRWAYADVQAIIGTTSTCDGCHDQSFTYSNLFNVGTTSTACDAVNRPRVVAGSAVSSLVYQKIAGTHDCGVRMPQGGPFLSATFIQKVADWIDGGALNTIP